MAEIFIGSIARHQETRTLLHRRVGNLEGGQERQRHAEHLEARALEAYGLRLSVPDDLLRLHTPHGRLVGLFFARLTGRVDAVIEGRDAAVAADCTFGAETSAIGRILPRYTTYE